MYVTDTHALIYFTSNKKTRLGRKARRIFEAADSGTSLIQVPTIVLWEVSLLLRQNYIILPQRFDHWCRSIESSRGFSILPLEWTDIDEARALPFADPYDCLVSGASRRMSLPLITKDDVIISSGIIDTIW